MQNRVALNVNGNKKGSPSNSTSTRSLLMKRSGSGTALKRSPRLGVKVGPQAVVVPPTLKMVKSPVYINMDQSSSSRTAMVSVGGLDLRQSTQLKL